MDGLEKPFIEMIQGFCIGGGLATALDADLRIASDDSKFGVPAAKLGLDYAYDGIKRLMDLVGSFHAKEIFFTSRQFTPAEALRMGPFNTVGQFAALEATSRQERQTLRSGKSVGI